ncbi:MAG: hypothetical protein WC466_03290 [Candidatus Izemoplasmatales bacterium]
MDDNIQYFTIIEDLKKRIENLEEKNYSAKNKKIDLKRQFSILNFPSNGLYYKNKKKSILIRYLTAVEEHVLCDYLLMENGDALKLIISNLVLDEDFDLKNILLNDFQAILIFLRSTAYGDFVDLNITCPYCSKESEYKIKLSELKFKEPKHEPDDNGNYIVFLEDLNLEITICPITLEREIQKQKENEDDDFFVVKMDDGTQKRIKKEKTLSLIYHIESINGVTDKSQIKKVIKRLQKKYIDYILDFIKENESGIDERISLVCPFCAESFFQQLAIGYDFLSMPANYKENIYEEIFLLTYYGKSITREDAMLMPVVERKWHIRRIKEEVDKQNEAEKRAINKAKSNKGKF